MAKTIISEIMGIFKKNGNTWLDYNEIYVKMDKSVFGTNKYGEKGRKAIVSRMLSGNSDFRENLKPYPRKFKLKASVFKKDRNKKHKIKHSVGDKGKLLKGMTKRLPKEILEDPVLEDALKEMMKKYGGIYALYSGDKLYYVGLTINFAHRIKNHLNNHHKNKWDRFAIFHIKQIAYLKDIETIITRIVGLEANIQKGHIPKNSGDISRELLHRLKDYQKNSKKIEDALR